MPRKSKTKPLEPALNKSDEECDDVKVDTYDAVVNLIQGENQADVCDIEDVAPPTVEKVKKVRAPRKKKEVEPPIAVSEDGEPEQLEEPAVVEDKKKDENT